MDHAQATGGQAILVVEDEAVIALDLCSMLSDMGYNPLGPARSVKKALHIINCQGVDAALLDENLSGTAVTPVADALHSRGVPFVIVSGHVRPVSDHPALQNAPRISKPTTSSSILEALENFW